ncbi:MAG: HpsJ family protein [Nodosilinea sp.]
MTNIPTPRSTYLPSGLLIARIVGFTCLAGFVVDMLALVLPPGAGAGWRVSLLQQMADRSIVLMLALALLLYGFWDILGLRKLVAYCSLGIGVAFLMVCILVIRDGLTLQSQAVDRIGQQAQELQTQIEQSKTNPDIFSRTPAEEFAQAAQAVDNQADVLKQQAKASLTKASIASTSSFVVMGIGLISLGRVGLGGTTGLVSPSGSKKARKAQRRAVG